MPFGKVAAVLAVVVFTANAQCLASCEFWLCSDLAKQSKPAQSTPDSRCHSSPAPDDKPDHSREECSHQRFMSEAGTKSAPSSLGTSTFEIVPALTERVRPQVLGNLNVDLDRPPPLLVVSTITVLRV